MAERQVPSTKKATGHREDQRSNKQAPSSSREDPELVTLVAGLQPQLQREHQQPPNIISDTKKPLTRETYGGGMHGTEEEGSKDGPEEQRPADQRASHPPPPSTGDDVSIFGQSFIQVGMH